MFSKDLEHSIGQCYKRARDARHEFMTVEHLVLALLDNPSAEAVLKAVNLGHDTDTTAAVTGGLAALAYGEDSIPGEWIEAIPRIDLIIGILQRFDRALKEKLP